MDLQQKIIVITGGKGLLGTAFVEHAKQAGATVICADVQCADDLENGECRVDITDETSVRSTVGAIVAQYGRIDGWVNNAYPRSKDWGTPFEKIPFASLAENLTSHLGGYFLCCQAVLPQMRKQGSGSLINMGSIYGFAAPDFSLYEGNAIAPLPEYHAIKGGIVQLTRHLAAQYGPHGVRVNTLSPGGVLNNHDPVFRAKYEARTPLRRLANLDDIAPAMVFLLSDAAKYITSHNLIVDGGWSGQ